MTQALKIKLAAIAKDEGLYLPLWVYHHLRFGFDVLDIRINGTTDNSWAVLEKLKIIYGERLRFSLVDKEMEECRAKDINFQCHIYTKIHQEALAEDFTHLMFLDIDEYWCSVNFSETIKDFLAKVNHFDVCMFQWLMESPDPNRSIDDFAFKPFMRGQKSIHVKSLLCMQAPAVAIRVHNYIVRKGKYILPDQTTVQFEHSDRARGLLPNENFEATRLALANYFVYHQVFRSQDEYLAGLLRGNKQNGDDSLLKTNRFGFVSNDTAEFDLTWQLPEGCLANYLQDYKKIIESLEVERIQAREFVLDRKELVLKYLKDDIFLQALHKNKMRGLSPEVYLPKQVDYPIKVKLEFVGFNEATEACNITCKVISEGLDYELVITQSFNKEPIAASINLIETKQKPPRTVKRFQIDIEMASLAYVIYEKWPPFCLAAKVNDELVLLERSLFRGLGDIVAPKAKQLRKAMLEQPVVEEVVSTPIQAQVVPTKPSFWRRLLGKA